MKDTFAKARRFAAELLSARGMKAALALLLAVVMSFGAFPAGRIFADGSVGKAPAAVEPAKGTGPRNGTIDGCVYWWLENNGTLKIRLLNSVTADDGRIGFGYQTDSANNNNNETGNINKKTERINSEDWPWHGRRDEITSVVFLENSNGLKVGFHLWSNSGSGRSENRMFADCPNLTSVDLSGLDTANAGALASMFRNCTSLTEVNLGNFTTDSKMKNLQSMFNGCTALTKVTLPSSEFVLANDAETSFMFENCTSLSTIENLENLKVTGVKNMKGMFKNCDALTTLNLSSFGTLERILSMDQLVYGCDSLETLFLDNMDNSRIGSTSNLHSVSDPYPATDGRSWFDVGAREYGRDLGLMYCPNIKTVSANNSKIWMVKDNTGLPGNEYFNVSSSGNILWWWMGNAWWESDSESHHNNGLQLEFTSQVSGKTYTLNKRDYVDLIADRDGVDGHQTPGVSTLPDAETNINIKDGDLNPHGAGFLAPGVYTKLTTPWDQKQLYMPYTEYRISYIGSVPYSVFVNGSRLDFGSASSVQYGELIFIKGSNNSFYINTVKQHHDAWTANGSSYEIVCGENGNPTIDIVYHRAVADNAYDDGDVAAPPRKDVMISIDKITFKDLNNIPMWNDLYGGIDRINDSNNYVDRDGAGEYYRSVLSVKKDGVHLYNYLNINAPETLTENATRALSGGAGTNIDFNVTLIESIGENAEAISAETLQKVEGSDFAFYVDDLDVPYLQDYNRPYPQDASFDYLPEQNVTYGVGGEGFVLGSGNRLNTVTFSGHTGLALVNNTRAGEANYVVSTGSDPDTAWSEFAVVADSAGSHYTWTGGVGCTTYALRNTPRVHKQEHYIVYDFSNRIGHSITAEIPAYAEAVDTVISDKFARIIPDIANDTVNIDIKEISSEIATVGLLLKCDLNHPANTKGIDYEWLNIKVIPATNVHYEESYLSYTDGKDSGGNSYAAWAPEGSAINPVYDVTNDTMIGNGAARQSDANTVYGHDASYAGQANMDSNGRSMHIHLGQTAFDAVKAGGSWPTAKFTFTGTGFDIIGRIGVNSGVYAVTVKNVNTDNYVYSQIVRTRYFGNTVNANGADSDMLYQVPIIHADAFLQEEGAEMALPNTDYGTYEVEIRFLWMPALAYLPENYNPNMKGAISIPGIPELDYKVVDLFEGAAVKGEATYPDFDIYLDAIRIYNPADNNDPIVEEAYTAANEFTPMYQEFRDVIMHSTETDLTGGGIADHAMFAIDLTPHQVPKPKYVQATDPDTNEPLFDGDGNPVYVQATDPVTGELMFDRFGNPVYVQETDENGEPVYEIDPTTGEPVYEDVIPQDLSDYGVSYYEAYGPNNEVYLKGSQGFAFRIDEPMTVHISAKAPAGATKMLVIMRAGGFISQEEVELSSSTEMYYDITHMLAGVSPEAYPIYFAAVPYHASKLISLCQIKIAPLTDNSTQPSIKADRDAFDFAVAVIADFRGDLNRDGEINMIDALLVMRSVLGSATLTPAGVYCADTNRDGIVNMLDALEIMRSVLD
ncbi:MAG: BspA family leucine-rich repeat surface protein [Clostridia bacterium]|nr:BspA family leucine-rich repeat surface protein [Clostridia bacterium]